MTLVVGPEGRDPPVPSQFSAVSSAQSLQGVGDGDARVAVGVARPAE